MTLRTSRMKTFGLTHVALAVRDPARSLEFYEKLVGAVPVYREADMIQAQTPGTHDVLVFERDESRAGKTGGIAHFGFRLQRPIAVAEIVERVNGAGGKVRSQGEFAPGLPYVFCEDPDGYEVEIWYESPTAVDPPRRQPKKTVTRSSRGGNRVRRASRPRRR